MTLAEKIAALRGERKLSQGDLAEKLDVSRQSVSKWETGQAVPELDKIIRLADLFGITVDELVRDGAIPGPEASGPEAATAAEPGIVYIERPRKGLTPIQILGTVIAATGAAITILALYEGDPEMVILGPALVCFALPLLLAKKHPVLICGWMIWAVGYLLLCNPYVSGALGGPWLPFAGFVNSLRWLIVDGARGGDILVIILFLLASYTALSALTIALPVRTLRLGWEKWKCRGRTGEVNSPQ